MRAFADCVGSCHLCKYTTDKCPAKPNEDKFVKADKDQLLARYKSDKYKDNKYGRRDEIEKRLLDWYDVKLFIAILEDVNINAQTDLCRK